MKYSFYILIYIFLLSACNSDNKSQKKPSRDKLNHMSNTKFFEFVYEYLFYYKLTDKEQWDEYEKSLYEEWKKRIDSINDAFLCDSLKIRNYPSEGCQKFSTQKWLTGIDSSEKFYPDIYLRSTILNDLWNNYLNKNLKVIEIENLLGRPESIPKWKDLEAHLLRGSYSIQYDYNSNSRPIFYRDTTEIANHGNISQVYMYTQGFSGSGPGKLVILWKDNKIFNILALRAE